MIKLRYVYSNGKEIKSFIYTIEEIEDGIVPHEEWAKDLKKDGLKLISRDRFTGLKDKNGVEIFENDIVIGNYLKGNGLVEWNKQFCKFDISHKMNISPSDVFEIISNTHIDNLKDNLKDK